MNRFRPRFSVRTLAIFVTLACCYFGAWEATKKWGVPETVEDRFMHTVANSPAPFIVRQETWLQDNTFSDPSRVYWIWFFGHTFKLPFESTW